MSELLPFVIVGLTTGAVYGLAATGLVLTYKTSGIFNFAHGAVGTAAAYTYYELVDRQGLPWWAGFIVGVFVVGPLLGLLLELFSRRLAMMSTAMKIVGTLGLVLIVQAGASLLFGDDGDLVQPFLPTDTYTIFSTAIGYDQTIIVGISLVATIGLGIFLARTRYGSSMRAVVDNPDLLASQGVNPAAVRRTSWLIGSTFAALSGVLLLPQIGLDSLSLTLLIIQAFGAAAIGHFSSLPRTYIGALIVGVGVSLATEYLPSTGILAGFPAAVPFLVLFLVLIFSRKGWLASHSIGQLRPQPVWRAPNTLQVGGGAVLLAVMLLVPVFAGTNMPFYISAMASVVMFLSLGLLVRTSKQMSLAHMGFAAIGAAAFGHLAGNHHWPWLLALLIAGLVAVPVGAIIAVPAIRLSTLFLALATLGFGIGLQQMFYTSDLMFGATSNGLPAPRPSWFSTDEAYYYLCLIIVVIVAAGIILLHRARFGRLLRGLGDSPVALNTLGTTTNLTRPMVFCLSAFLAAVSGALMAAGSSSVSSSTFPPFSSLTLVVLLALIPGREPWYAFGGAFALYVIPSFFTTIDINDWLTLLFGVAAIRTAATSELKQGGSPRLRALLERVPQLPVPRLRRHPAAAEADDATIMQRVTAESGGLKIDNLTVRFGGAVAVDDLALEAPLGRITGLIGPNGAGKTTTFNACSGLVQPSSGNVSLHGRRISRLSPSARGRRGLGRTFQRMELFDSLTVAENVALGAEAVRAGLNPLSQLICSAGERSRIQAKARQAMDLCGIAGLAGTQAGVLSTGQRRLVELARCLAGPYELLLLDEPSSGLDHEETRRFGEILTRVVAERGVGLLLVEHDMSLVMSVCDYLYVLDFGQLIEQGTPEHIAASRIVRDAYLGSSHLSDDAAAEAPDVTAAVPAPLSGEADV